MNLLKRAIALASKLSLGAIIGVFVFRGDACICGGAHPPPPPPPANTAAPSATPPPPG